MIRSRSCKHCDGSGTIGAKAGGGERELCPDCPPVPCMGCGSDESIVRLEGSMVFPREPIERAICGRCFDAILAGKHLPKEGDPPSSAAASATLWWNQTTRKLQSSKP